MESLLKVLLPKVKVSYLTEESREVLAKFPKWDNWSLHDNTFPSASIQNPQKWPETTHQESAVGSVSQPPARCHKGVSLETVNPLYRAFSKSLFVLSIKSAQLTGAFTVLRLQNNVN